MLLQKYLLACAGICLCVSLQTCKAHSETECKLCYNITHNFHEGVRKTYKHNFGGGNTAWEERKLGTYVRSETRLITILEEHVCGKSKDDFKCQQFVERHESDIERWWFDVFSTDMENALQVDSAKSLRWYLCVDQLKICCDSGRYGEQCDLTCSSTVCNDHGKCEVDGTRSLNARKCICDETSTGANCERCKSGWYRQVTAATSDSPSDGQAISSFTCERCDWRCATCIGQPNYCQRCRSGFERVESTNSCVDVDECMNNATACEALGAPYATRCVNTEGSFRCECAEGHLLDKAPVDPDWDDEADSADEDELPEETEARLALAAARRREASGGKCASIVDVVTKRRSEDVAAILERVPLKILQREVDRMVGYLQSQLTMCLVVLAGWCLLAALLYWRLGAQSIRMIMFLCAFLFAYTYWQFSQIGTQAEALERLNVAIGQRSPPPTEPVDTPLEHSEQHDEF